MNYSPDELSLGREWYRRRAKTFLALAIVFFVLTVIGIVMAFTSREDRFSLIPGSAHLGVLAVFFLILYVKMRHEEKNLAWIRHRGEVIVARLKETTPDFDPTNEFVLYPGEKASPKVWVDQSSKQIQFLLPFPGRSNPRKRRREKLRKTKAMEVDLLRDIQLLISTETISHYGAYALNPMAKTTFIAGRGMETKKTIGYYSVDFFFDDVELPYIRIFYDRDGEGARRLYYAIKTLRTK